METKTYILERRNPNIGCGWCWTGLTDDSLEALTEQGTAYAKKHLSERVNSLTEFRIVRADAERLAGVSFMDVAFGEQIWPIEVKAS